MSLIITTSVVSIIMILFMLMTKVPNEQPHPRSGDYYTYSIIFIVAFFLVLTFTAAFREGFQDTGLYKVIYKALVSSPSRAFDDDFVITDKGFNILMLGLMKISTNPQTLIIFCAVAITGIYVFAVTRYSPDLPFSLLLFLFLVYIPTFNGIRQILAGAVIVLAWPWLRDKKFIKFILVVLLASTIHASAILLVPLCFLISGKRFNFGLILFAVAIAFFFVFPSAAMKIMGSFLEDSTYDEYMEIDSKMGFMRVLVELVPVVLGFLYHRFTRKKELNDEHSLLTEQNRRMIDVMINMQIISFGFTILGLQMVYFARIALYFSIVTPIVIPRLINDVFGEKSYTTIKSLALVLYGGYFAYQIYTYQMIDNWGGMELIF